VHGGATARNPRTFISFRVSTKYRIVATGSEMGRCAVLAKGRTFTELVSGVTYQDAEKLFFMMAEETAT